MSEKGWSTTKWSRSGEREFNIPEDMAFTAWKAMDKHFRVHNPAVGCVAGSPCSVRHGLEAALRWLTENPIVPTDAQVLAISDAWDESEEARRSSGCTMTRFVATEWQRRCFLAPEPEVPKDIEDLLIDRKGLTMPDILVDINAFDNRIIESYRRGKESQCR